MVDRLNKPNKGVQDWHKPVNENFEDVEEASYVERTVADFEGGTLDTDFYNGDTSDFSVQNSVVESGSYALKGDRSSTGNSDITSKTGLESYPQQGDVIEFYTYLTDTDDQSRFEFAKQSAGAYQIQVRADSDFFTIRNTYDGNNPNANPTPISNYLNEWLRVVVKWYMSGKLEATVYDSADSQINSISATPNTIVDSGGIEFDVQNYNTAPTIYFDSITLERRETEARTNTQKGTTQLGNEVVPSGGINTGPQEVPPDHPNYPVVNLPVTEDLEQGDTVGYHLAIQGNSVVRVEADADGSGGTQNRRAEIVGDLASDNINATNIQSDKWYGVETRQVKQDVGKITAGSNTITTDIPINEFVSSSNGKSFELVLLHWHKKFSNYQHFELYVVGTKGGGATLVSSGGSYDGITNTSISNTGGGSGTGFWEVSFDSNDDTVFGIQVL